MEKYRIKSSMMMTAVIRPMRAFAGVGEIPNAGPQPVSAVLV